MKIICQLILFIMIVALNENLKSQTFDSLYQVGTWPGFRQGAVSFTFDDNCPNQLSVVMPMFDHYGFKMTFFTVINWNPNWAALQAAAANGHEIASHTVTHAVLNSLTNDQQTVELKNSQDVINSHIKGQKCLTIAYPNCVAGNSTICSQYYIAARGCSGSIVPKTPPDFMNISSIVCGSQGSIQRASDFENKMNAAASSNGWVVFLIHAIDGESGYSPTSSAEIKGALDYLDRNKDKLWEATFGDVVHYIKERNNVSVNELSAGDSMVTFRVTETLDDSIYNYPVSIRRVFPPGWSSASITQNGKELDSKIVSENSKNFIMFEAVPDGGNIQMKKNNATGVSKNLKSQILSPYLMQNYPNPFNPVTTIDYKICEYGLVTLRVYDLLGREVTTLVNEQLSPGNYFVKFDGSKLPSGFYLYKLNTGNYASTKKIIILK